MLVSVLRKAYCRRFAGVCLGSEGLILVWTHVLALLVQATQTQQSQLVNRVCLYADRQIQCCQANRVCKTPLDDNADDCGIVAGAHFVLQV